MNKGAVALLALATMVCVSGPAYAAKKGAKNAATVENCRAFLAAQEANDSGAKPAGKSKLTVEGCQELVAAEDRKAADLEAYRQGYAEAQTVADLELFIDMFQGNDPDKLVPKAKARVKELKAKEAAEATEAPAAQ